jgi:hypothetical protein
MTPDIICIGKSMQSALKMAGISRIRKELVGIQTQIVSKYEESTAYLVNLPPDEQMCTLILRCCLQMSQKLINLKGCIRHISRAAPRYSYMNTEFGEVLSNVSALKNAMTNHMNRNPSL